MQINGRERWIACYLSIISISVPTGRGQRSPESTWAVISLGWTGHRRLNASLFKQKPLDEVKQMKGCRELQSWPLTSSKAVFTLLGLINGVTNKSGTQENYIMTQRTPEHTPTDALYTMHICTQLCSVLIK